jgi:hydrogenase maturation protease
MDEGAEVAVIGLGNPLAGDEGVGVRLVEELQEKYECAGVEVRELGTSLFSLIHVLPGKTKAIIIDCALMGEKPGTIRRFGFAEAKSVKSLAHFSLHEGDAFELIGLAEKIDPPRPDVVFFGIEPEKMEPGSRLSAALEPRIGEYLELIAAEAGLAKRVAGDA